MDSDFNNRRRVDSDFDRNPNTFATTKADRQSLSMADIKKPTWLSLLVYAIIFHAIFDAIGYISNGSFYKSINLNSIVDFIYQFLLNNEIDLFILQSRESISHLIYGVMANIIPSFIILSIYIMAYQRTMNFIEMIKFGMIWVPLTVPFMFLFVFLSSQDFEIALKVVKYLFSLEIAFTLFLQITLSLLLLKYTVFIKYRR